MKVDKLLLQGVTLSRDSTLLLTDSLASLPTNFSSITHVDVSNTGIEIEGFHALCDALAALPEVQVLVAKDNGLPKEGERVWLLLPLFGVRECCCDSSHVRWWQNAQPDWP